MSVAKILSIAAVAEKGWETFMRENCGYTRITTFFSDFTIADLCGGEQAIRDTFNRSKHWISDVKYWTELVLVLNHKIWILNDENEELAKVYDELWRTAANMAEISFTGEELDYYFRTID
jgi:hypothetical protein